MSTMKNLQLNCDILNVLDDTFYTLTKSSPLQNPKIVSVNKILAKEMQIDNDVLNSKDFKNFQAVFLRRFSRKRSEKGP